MSTGPSVNLRTVPEADKPREQVENRGRACTQVLCRGNRSKIVEGHVLRSFTFVKQSGDFSLFRNSDRMAGTFRWSEDPSTEYSPGLYLPPQKIPLAETRFLQASKVAENTKEKSR
jgi:hypothetical protein